MRETEADLDRLQALIDSSHASAGPHLASIFDAPRRLTARQVAAFATGVQVLALGTVTAHGEPLVAPVDGLLFHGRWHFGSSPESVRFTHLRARPAVSAALIVGEEAAVLTHGHAELVDTADPAHAELRDLLVETYGDDWHDWGAGSQYARIEPRRVFTFAHHPERFAG